MPAWIKDTVSSTTTVPNEPTIPTVVATEKKEDIMKKRKCESGENQTVVKKQKCEEMENIKDITLGELTSRSTGDCKGLVDKVIQCCNNTIKVILSDTTGTLTITGFGVDANYLRNIMKEGQQITFWLGSPYLKLQKINPMFRKYGGGKDDAYEAIYRVGLPYRKGGKVCGRSIFDHKNFLIKRKT